MSARYYIRKTRTRKFLTNLFEDDWKKMFTSDSPMRYRCYSYAIKEIAEDVATNLSSAHNITCKAFPMEER